MSTAASESFSLPRLSRVKTRPRDRAPRWSDWLAQLAFGAMLALAFCGPWMTDQGSEMLSQLRAIGYAGIAVLALLAIRPWRQPQRVLVVPWPLLVALGWCWLTLAWAKAPLDDLRGVILTTIVLWTVFALVRQLGIERTVTIVRVMLAALLVVNFLVSLFYPAVGVHPPDDGNLAGDWRGIMGQKNFAGLASAVTILFCAFGPGRWPMALRIGVAAAATLFLVLSDSATSLGMCVAALIVGAGFAWAAKRYGQRQLVPPVLAWIPLALLALIFVSLALDPRFYLGLVSDPSGFTGRNQIWSILIQVFELRPWLGVGYNSLWDVGPNGPLASFTPGGLDWVAQLSQAHNGYIDLLVQIGVFGTLIVLFATLVWPLQRLLRGGDDPARVLAASMLFFCFGHNLTESSLFDRDGLGQVFLLIAIALLWGATAATAVPVQASAEATAPKARRRSGDTRRKRSRSKG